MKKQVVIIGSGPAGLSCAYHILKEKKDYKVIIIESEDKIGGIAKTFYEDGNGTDIGPHRFFTRNEDVLKFWNDMLPFQGLPSSDDILLNRKIDFSPNGSNPEKEDNVFLKRKRFSRIYYNNHFLDYPIKLKPEIIFTLGFAKTFEAGMSYLKSCFLKVPETNLETFMINRFGRVLYELFFEGYTEKVWGVHPSKISKEWGTQRIKGISLIKVLLNALLAPFKFIKKETSLIDEYYYPKLGASQLWEKIAEEIIFMGGEIVINTRVTSVSKIGNSIKSLKVLNRKTNEYSDIYGDIFVSSMPIKDLITQMNNVPDKIYKLADNMQYRDFILVNFVTENLNLKNNTNFPTIQNIAPDSWIYLQDNGIKAGRLDIMNNFSPYIIKDFKNNFVINLEYFCNEKDEFWNLNDEDIISFAKSELKNLNVSDKIISSKVIRVLKAYPSYFGSYEKFNDIKSYLNTIDNLLCIGRNGQHKYNNMDHSILSGMTSAKIILNNSDKQILWEVNTDKEYQEIKHS